MNQLLVFFVLAAAFVAVISSEPVPPSFKQCSSINTVCGGETPCCDGLRCEAEDSVLSRKVCKSHWSTVQKNSGEVSTEIERVFLQSIFSFGLGPCIGRAGNCALSPNGCCPGLSCKGDAFGFWSCERA